MSTTECRPFYDKIVIKVYEGINELYLRKKKIKVVNM